MAVRDKELQAEYNSAAPGTKLSRGFTQVSRTSWWCSRGRCGGRLKTSHHSPRLEAPCQYCADDHVRIRGDGTRPAIWVDVNPTHSTPSTRMSRRQSLVRATKVSFNRQPASTWNPTCRLESFRIRQAHPEAQAGVRGVLITSTQRQLRVCESQ